MSLPRWLDPATIRFLADEEEAQAVGWARVARENVHLTDDPLGRAHIVDLARTARSRARRLRGMATRVEHRRLREARP